MPSSAIAYGYLRSPVGPLLIAGDEEGLRLIQFMHGRAPVRPEPTWREDLVVLADAREQLCAYFAGELTRFKLRLEPVGTPFQLEVWQALRAIPYGQTVSYGEVARQIGRPDASRAVGAANGANPLPIVVPCHRVIGANGALTGFGGGLDAKRFLLSHERRHTGAQLELL